MVSHHQLSPQMATNGLLILEEAAAVLQCAAPTRLRDLQVIILTKPVVVNPFMPTVVFNICCPRDCVSRHNAS